MVWQANCSEIKIKSSPGKFGFYPWIDRKNNYYGIIGTYNPTQSFAVSVKLGQKIQPMIVSALESLTTTTGTSTSTTGASITTTGMSGTTTAGTSSGATESPTTSGNGTTGLNIDSGAVISTPFVVLLLSSLFFMYLL